ncbi:MAG: hypothetical protein ACRD37_10765 [Candidatus Acidiferrales bacterium]
MAASSPYETNPLRRADAFGVPWPFVSEFIPVNFSLPAARR